MEFMSMDTWFFISLFGVIVLVYLSSKIVRFNITVINLFKEMAKTQTEIISLLSDIRENTKHLNN